MVSSISNADKTLDTEYANYVNLQIQAEREQYVKPYETQRDTLELEQSVYKDLTDYLSSIRTQAQSLISTNSSYLLDDNYTGVVSGQTDGTTVLTAEVENDALPHDYSIEVVNLAKNHRIASDRKVSSTSALALNGSLTINGVSLYLENSDTLYSIASKINSAAFDEDEGNGVTASVVDNRLVLTANESGADHEMVLTDTNGILDSLGITDSGSFKNELSQALDAEFIIDGITVNRSSNTDIDDVIDGVTLNFASDAEGQTVKLSVQTDVDTVITGIESLANKLNTALKYITAKTSVTKVDEDNVQKGVLAGNLTVLRMRSSLVTQMDTPLSGFDYTYLRDIGIAFDDDMTMKIIDKNLLETALIENFDGVTEFLDAKMGSLEDQLDTYVGSEGVLTYTAENYETRIGKLDSRIEQEGERLLSKEEMLIQQYLEIQETMYSLNNELTTINALNTNLYNLMSYNSK